MPPLDADAQAKHCQAKINCDAGTTLVNGYGMVLLVQIDVSVRQGLLGRLCLFQIFFVPALDKRMNHDATCL
jgi:hypothetical protein